MLRSTGLLILPALLVLGTFSEPVAAQPPFAAKGLSGPVQERQGLWLPVKSFCKKVFVCLEQATDANGNPAHGCAKYKIVNSCKEGNGSEMPPQNPPKVHVPPFERRLRSPGPSLGRQGPAIHQGAHAFGRRMPMPGSGASMRRGR